MKVKIKDIKVGDRQRKVTKNVDELASSISKIGLLNPIIVDRDLNLVAGFRRLEAHKILRLDEIEVNFVDDLDELGRKEIELEENLQRENLLWWEEDLARKELDDLKKAIYGSKLHGGDWSTSDTAASLGESESLVRLSIQMAKAIEVMPELREEKTRSAALKRWKSEQIKAAKEELIERAKQSGKEKRVRVEKGDALKLIKEVPEGSVDMAIVDPPFGVGLESQTFDVKSYKTYKDAEEDARRLYRGIIPEIYRVLKKDAHAYVFYPIGQEIGGLVLDFLDEVFDFVDHIPLVWVKGTGGFTVDLRYRYKPVYQSILFATKGRRPLNQTSQSSNVIEVPSVPPGHKCHPAEAPVELFEILIEKSTMPDDLVIDPFCGSGASMVACLRHHRRGLGFEIEDEYHREILFRLAKEEGSL